MKKISLILITVLLLAINSTRANENNNKIPEPVVSTFRVDFSDANNVNWETGNGYYRASFNQGGLTLFAFYTDEADYMGIANNILSLELPKTLQSDLKKKFSGYWITSLFRFNINGTPGYFVSLENAEKTIMLKTDEKQNWQLYKMIDKN